MLARRVIPCLDVHDGQVTRGVQFGRAEAGELRNVGDPVELAMRYNEQGADEMVFFDITASAHARASMADVIRRAAEKTQWVLNYARAMGQELAELTDSVPWKWWAKYQTFDEQNARVEVVDLFHFLISLAQVLGMSADDVYAAYVKKNEVNFQRQESGYTEKDHGDSRHI